jgi:hypothetical protein
MIGLGSFESFDDAVVGTAGDDAQAVSDRFCRLMVGRVHGNDQGTSDLSVPTSNLCGYDLREFRFRFDLDGVRDRHLLSRFMIDSVARLFGKEIGDVLNERSGAIDVQALQSVADAKHRLARGVRTLQKEIVNGIAAGVGGRGAGRAWRSEACRIDICIAPGQQDSVAGLHQPQDGVTRLLELNPDRLSSHQGDGLFILRDCPLSILVVR